MQSTTGKRSFDNPGSNCERHGHAASAVQVARERWLAGFAVGVNASGDTYAHNENGAGDDRGRGGLGPRSTHRRAGAGGCRRPASWAAASCSACRSPRPCATSTGATARRPSPGCAARASCWRRPTATPCSGRPPHQMRLAQERYLAAATAQGVEANSQPVRSCSSVTADGHSSPRDRTNPHWRYSFGQPAMVSSGEPGKPCSTRPRKAWPGAAVTA